MKLLLRADAGLRLGTGHIMRTLALAQAWRNRGGEVRLLTTSLPEHLHPLLSKERIWVNLVRAEPGSDEDATITKKAAEEWGADWVVLDGYHFGSVYQEKLASEMYGRLVVDDYGHAKRYDAEIVLNQNLYAKYDDYSGRAEGARLLLGPSYIMLRKEFWPWRSWRRQLPELRTRVLLTMGGTDPNDATGRLLRATHGNPSLEIITVVGGANPRTYYEQIADPRIRVRRNVDTMPLYMCWAHIALAAGGTTALELLFMQLPGAYVVLADNQTRVVEALERHGLGLAMGRIDVLDNQFILQELDRLIHEESLYNTIVAKSAGMVDGWGVERVVDAMLEHSWDLRPATAKDAETLWRWANDPVTRSVSLSSDPIPWSRHVRWLDSKLEDPDVYLWLAVNERGTPIGQIRFDRIGEEAVVSVGLDPQRRGLGIGPQLIRRSTDRLMRTKGIMKVRAHIKPDNVISRRAFSRAGYKAEGKVNINGQVVVEMTYSAKEVECEF